MSESQGQCEITLTERFVYTDCKCGTYKDNLGPCKTWERGASGQCVFCEHGVECHTGLLSLELTAARTAIETKDREIADLETECENRAQVASEYKEFNAKMFAEAVAQSNLLRKAGETLAPFAKLADSPPIKREDGRVPRDDEPYDYAWGNISWGWLRKARATLTELRALEKKTERT